VADLTSRMRSRPRLAIAVTFVVASAILSAEGRDAEACRCIAGLSVAKYYSNADLVVLGQVTSIENTAATNTSKAVVAIESGWKLPVTGSVTVFSDGTCAFQFIKGQRYLLYLKRAAADTFGTTKCSGNKRADLARGEIRWLRRHDRGPSLIRPTLGR